MREVANMSARTALNTHASKRIRDSIGVKCMLTIASAGLSAMFFMSPRWSRFSFETFGWMTSAVTCVLLCEILRSSFKVNRLKVIKPVGDLHSRMTNPDQLTDDSAIDDFESDDSEEIELFEDDDDNVETESKPSALLPEIETLIGQDSNVSEFK